MRSEVSVYPKFSLPVVTCSVDAADTSALDVTLVKRYAAVGSESPCIRSEGKRQALTRL